MHSNSLDGLPDPAPKVAVATSETKVAKNADSKSTIKSSTKKDTSFPSASQKVKFAKEPVSKKVIIEDSPITSPPSATSVATPKAKTRKTSILKNASVSTPSIATPVATPKEGTRESSTKSEKTRIKSAQSPKRVSLGSKTTPPSAASSSNIIKSDSGPSEGDKGENDGSKKLDFSQSISTVVGDTHSSGKKKIKMVSISSLDDEN